MSLGGIGAWLAIGGGLGLLAAVRWADALLADEARYLAAVRGLPSSALARRVTPVVVAIGVRRWGVPGRWSTRLGRRVGRVAGGRTAGVLWVAAHRRLHRAGPTDWRRATTMLVLAAVGTVASPRHRAGEAPRAT